MEEGERVHVNEVKITIFNIQSQVSVYCTRTHGTI